MAALLPDFDERHFRGSLSRFATGVTIITTRTASGDLVGFTANSFNSVSMDPPLVLWSLGTGAASLGAFVAGTHYAINVLSSGQIDLSRRFSQRIPNRFEGLDWHAGRTGVPILNGCCAWFECFNRNRYEEGDHVIFIGEVERCGFDAEVEPLIFQGGRYHTAQSIEDSFAAKK